MIQVRDSTRPRVRVAHELPRRLRLRSNGFKDPSLDADYLAALVAAQPGVAAVRVNQRAGSVVVEHDGSAGLKERVLDLLRRLPGDAFAPDLDANEAPDRAEVAVRAGLAAITPFLPRPAAAALSWGLAAPTLLKGARTLFTEGLKVEVLDGGVKLFSLLRRDYFTSNVVGALLALAEHVEHATERKTNDLLKGLLRPRVEYVRVRREGVDVQIPFAECLLGDLVLCGPGEMIAVDGRVVEGEAYVNTASISGESAPVHLKPGDEAISGGVVEEGALVVRASSVGSDTSTARIAGYIEKSLRNKSDKQKRTEDLADRLTPLTFGVGLGVFALTGSLSRAASVLTVDYSCAVKLATPVAVRSAMYAAGREGVLLKGASALHALARVDTLVFDKTGTLTEGALEVTDVIPLVHSPESVAETLDEDRLLSLAAGAEEHYAHPVAAAVVAAARERGLASPEMKQVDFVVAHGVSAYVDGERILVGSRHFIHDDEAVDCSVADGLADELYGQGKNLLYVAKNGRLAGVVAMRDTPREEAGPVLRELKRLGVTRLVMLTGDQRRAADALRRRLPELDEARAECKPEDKARVIEELRAEGRNIAFVGDGVNDAPALIAADVGVCMPSGADLARDVAQVILLRDSLEGLALAKRLADRADAILRQCLWFSLSLNSVLLGLATGGYIPAALSALAHNGGTIGVLGYAALRGSSAPSESIPTQRSEA